MACTLSLYKNGNLPANCHLYAGTDRVRRYKGRSWSETGARAGGIREVATVATPAPGRERGTHSPTSLRPRARPTIAHDGDELGAVPEATLAGLGRDRP